MTKQDAAAQLAALDTLGRIFANIAVFRIDDQSLPATSLEHAFEILRERAHESLESVKRLDEAGRQLLASGFDVPTAWLALRSMSRRNPATRRHRVRLAARKPA